jgi:hypothetical protein
MVIKKKLITKLTVATSAILLLSLLMSAAALVYIRIMAAAPDGQKECARIETMQDIGDLRASALSLTLNRSEFAHYLGVVFMVILAVQAVMFISSGVSLFWLRRLKGTHDA